MRSPLACIALFAALGSTSSRGAAAPAEVTASVETAPVPHGRDAADDPVIWIHPTDPALSTVMGNDKHGAYEVYDLAGKRLQSLPVDAANTDLRYNFPLGREKIALVAGFSSTKGGLIAWRVNPATRLLEDVTAPGAKVESGGGGLYHHQPTGEFYWFSNHNGTLYQHRLYDDGKGRVTATLVRTFKYGDAAEKAEAAVADDELGVVYYSQEQTGVWKLPADPKAANRPALVDKPRAAGGHLEPDIEGLAIYHRPGGTGYLFVSSQGDNSYVAYTREGDNRYLGAFKIVDGAEVDGTSSTDGIEVTNVPLGPAFPHGLFVAQDGYNMEKGVRVNQNFKLVPFERIAKALGLTIDPSWDPRRPTR